MDLKTFVSETLTQIVEGVFEAKLRIAELGTNASVNPKTVRQGDEPEARKSDVEFDVAITVSDQEDASKTDKVGATAGFLSVVSAKITGEAGNERREQQKNESVSRVRFVVQLAQPSDIDDRTEETRRKREADNARLNRPIPTTRNGWMAR